MAKEAVDYGADKAVVVDGERFAVYSTEAYFEAFTQLCKKYKPSVVLAGTTQDAKDFIPRVAIKLETGCVSGVLDVEIADNENVIWTCSSYGGNVLSQVLCEGRPQIGIIHSSSFKKGEKIEKEAEIINETVPDVQLKARIKEAVKEISEIVNLEEAEVIVAGGRGMGSPEGFKLVWDFAQLLGGVVGATRAPIESGWVSRAHQIGQSGKTVAPKLYIACGISGATQHVAGIMGSDYIVAINKDEDASIFDIANVGIVGNAIEIIPDMMKEIKKILM